MDTLELSKLFIERAELMKRMAEIDAIITEEVLALGESQKIAGVKATYYNESAERDYQAAAERYRGSPEFDDAYKKCTTFKPVTRWKDICDELLLGDAAIPITVKPAKVIIK